MSVFEDMEFAVSNPNVSENDSISLDDHETIEALDECVSLADFKAVIHTALENVMNLHEVDPDDVDSYADFWEPDWFNIMNYHLSPAAGPLNEKGESLWLEQIIVLMHWLQSGDVYEDKQRALLQLIETQGWDVVMPAFVKDVEEFFESYEGTFDSKREFAEDYLEQICEAPGSFLEDFVEWDALIGYLDQQGYSFVEDTETYKTHVWNNHR